MSSICFIVAGMDKRKHFLERCIAAFLNSLYKTCDIFCYYQGELWDSVVGKEIFKSVIIDSKLRGVFTPRYELMKQFAKDYDYTVIIDDDLFIEKETDYYKAVKFVEFMGDSVVVSLSNSKTKNLIERRNDINIDGGMVIPRRGIMEILDYFRDKEKDYTFDYFWLFLYVKGFDLYKDWRSKSNHVPSRKVNGEFTGFNYSRYHLEYIPMMEEWFKPAKFADGHGSHGAQFIHVSDLTEAGKAERLRNKKLMMGGIAVGKL